MIEIQYVSDMQLEDIINLLLDQKEQPFNIYIPKATELFSSSNKDIAIDYAMLAYAGKLLKDASDKFEYIYIAPSDNQSIHFIVYAKDIEKLANAILEISYGYQNESEDSDVIFLENLNQFIEDIKKDKSNNQCSDFIEMYFEYIDKA